MRALLDEQLPRRLSAASGAPRATAFALPPLGGCSGLLGGYPPARGRAATDLGNGVARTITARLQVRGAVEGIPRGSAGSLKQDL